MSVTVKFLEIIVKFWKIVNVKSLGKGHRKRDALCEPVRSIDCENMVYLSNAHKWLVKWESLNQKARQGRLSDETRFALRHTVETLHEVVVYLFTDLKLSYVLLGKFQTDCLEFRFSLYRRLSGTNYHISVLELRESEKKLKIVSLLHVISASRGRISLRDILVNSVSDEAAAGDSGTELTCGGDISVFVAGLEKCDDLTITDSETKALVFVAGYVGFKVVKKVACEICKRELVCDKTLQVDTATVEFSYLAELDRGGLRWPTDFLIEVITQVFLVFQVLISKDYEAKFLCVGNQRAVLRDLSIERLTECGAVMGECSCGTKMIDLAKRCLPYITNICLNNYCKRSADRNHKGKSKTQRKLSTLHK